MDEVILALVAIAVGALVAGYGVRVFFLLLPLWAFLTGVALGTGAVSALAGDGPFATVLSWAAGIGVGALFAVVAGLWFWAAVVLLAFGAGAALAGGILGVLGVDRGVVTLAAGLAGGIGLALLAIAVDAPVLLVAVLTSYGGAAYGVAGAWLLLGQVTRADLAGGVLAALRHEPIGLAAWLVLGTLALVYQLMEARVRRVDLMASMPRARS